MTKKCNRCKVERSLTYFYKKNGWGDSHVGICKFCLTEQEKKRRQKKKEENIYSF